MNTKIKFKNTVKKRLINMKKGNTKYGRKHFNFILMLGSIVVFLLLGEVFARLYEYFTEVKRIENRVFRQTSQPDSLLMRWRKPNMVSFWNHAVSGGDPRDGINSRIETNSYGHIDKEYDINKKPNYRIILLGDSYAEAVSENIENTFHFKLEEALNERFSDIELINTAVSGWSTLIETRYFELRGMKWRPDLVLLLFCHNDIADNFRHAKYFTFDHDSLPIDSRFPIPKKTNDNQSFLPDFPMKNWLRENSYFYNLLRDRIARGILMVFRKDQISHERKVSKSENKEKRKLKEEKREEEISEDSWHGDPERDLWFIYRDPEIVNKQKADNAWKLTEKALTKLKILVDSINAKLILVQLTTGAAYENEWVEGRKTVGLDNLHKKTNLISNPIKRLKNICSKLEITHIDSYSYFRNSKIFPKYYTFDGHCNANGHQVLYKLFLEQIEWDLLIQGKKSLGN